MTYQEFEVFFLVLTRIAGFMGGSPIVSARGIPNLVKVGFVVTLGILIYPLVGAGVKIETTILGFALQVALEGLFGLALGFAVNIIFVSLQMGGQLVDFQIGFSMASAYDPLTRNKVSLYGRLYYWTGLSLFFAMDAHHYLIYILSETFEILPLGGIAAEHLKSSDVIFLFSSSFKTAFQLAIPLLLILFMTDIIMGMLARTVPQLNVFILGLPMKVLVGVTVSIFLMPAIIRMMIPVIEGIPFQLDRLLKVLVA
ncbi:MAG: flagellar biosynthetic protein FliR [Clostridiales bacterium]|nr:MAG: flagellar biosynthetic protein FliR [Clostridiales bacterium]